MVVGPCGWSEPQRSKRRFSSRSATGCCFGRSGRGRKAFAWCQWARSIRDLRLGEFDVLVGINLLREGLDIPEVSLVAILDADKEGFLRAERSLIQTIGRAARHINGMAILYADRMTDSMKAAIGETERRRARQLAWNEKMGITPIGVQKRIKDIIEGVYDPDEAKKEQRAAQARAKYDAMPEKDLERELKQLEKQMLDAAKNLEFEKAAELRDRLHELKRAVVWRRSCRSTEALSRCVRCCCAA